ncbi:MAG: DAK2 domain-containing protein [Clostridiales bacterium]|jgi:DAK2 domain fusion protein YloV|nr:DAK2 domain-containing protein [Clostridiales bacterium]
MEQLEGIQLEKMLIAGAHLLNNNKEVINAMNTFPVPDGDTGTNMSLTMRSALNEMQKANKDSVSSVAGALATGSLLGARGNSGVILSQLFRGFAKGLEGKDHVRPKEFAAAMQDGVNTAYRAVMKPVEGTMLTIGKESAKAAAISVSKGAGFVAMMEDVVRHAAIVLEKTPDMLPVLKEAGVVDAGGKGLLHIYEGFLLVLRGEEIPAQIAEVVEEHVVKPIEAFRTEDILYAYCTELMVRGESLDADRIRDKIGDMGDSVLAVGDEKMVKIHIHTNHPGQILELCVEYGSLHNIKIDNMKEQHAELLFEVPQPIGASRGQAVVAVAAGEGLGKIFESLGTAKVIQGGQTMNPSTEDILLAVNEVPQKEVIILPNNKNIVLAAKQVQELSDKEVRVIKTRSVPQGIAAMLAFNTDVPLDENVDSMKRARKKIKSGQVTFAVCDSKYNGKKIKINDIIGISEDDIVVVTNDVNKAVKDLLFSMVKDEDEIITLYYGEAVDKETAGRLQEELFLLFNGKDVEMYEGGQPFYYYIVSVE